MVVGMERGYRRDGKADYNLEAQALELASKAEVILYFLGLGETEESEGLDRKNFEIPQPNFFFYRSLQKNPEYVAVLSTGSVVDIGWKIDCRAILHTGLSGEAGAGAVLQSTDRES